MVGLRGFEDNVQCPDDVELFPVEENYRAEDLHPKCPGACILSERSLFFVWNSVMGSSDMKGRRCSWK